jgi:hypothetical protein
MTRLWGAPLALAIFSAVGLVSALLGDGAWNALSWLALAAPVVTVLWYAAPGRGVGAKDTR